MKTTIESLSPEAQRALWPAISSVIRGSQNRTLWEPPEDDELMELSDNTKKIEDIL